MQPVAAAYGLRHGRVGDCAATVSLYSAFAPALPDAPRTGQFRSPPTRSGSERAPASGSTPASRTAPGPAAAARSPRRPRPAPSAASSRSRRSASARRPASPTVQTPASFSVLERPRDVHDLRDLHVRDGAGRRLRRRAVERRRVPRLPDDAVGAGRVDRPQNRADVVRILDAVEHDDAAARPSRRATRSSTLKRAGLLAPRRRRPGATRAARQPIELVGADARAPGRPAPRPAGRRPSARSSARARHADRRHAPGAQRFEDRIDAVDQHAINGSITRARGLARLVTSWHQRRSSAPRRTPPRARGCPRIGGMPADAGSSAPRSIAGTARSSSGPSARPVSAMRIG